MTKVIGKLIKLPLRPIYHENQDSFQKRDLNQESGGCTFAKAHVLAQWSPVRGQ